jgi:hypothetical protein
LRTIDGESIGRIDIFLTRLHSEFIYLAGCSLGRTLVASRHILVRGVSVTRPRSKHIQHAAAAAAHAAPRTFTSQWQPLRTPDFVLPGTSTAVDSINLLVVESFAGATPGSGQEIAHVSVSKMA